MKMNAVMNVKNNVSTNELVAFLKSSKDQYKNLNKREEREMIEKYRYTDDERLRNLLVLHNLRYVFNLAKKYSKQTSDFDDLIGKGMYGLVVASKKFDLDKHVTKKIPVLDENGEQVYEYVQRTRKSRSGVVTDVVDRKTGKPVLKKVPKIDEEIQFESDGVTPKFVKFNTYATSWILKYMRKEFNDERDVVASKFLSINKSVGDDGDGGQDPCTMENYIASIASPDFTQVTMDDDLSAIERTDLCRKIYDFVDNDSQLSAVDKRIFFDSFIGNKMSKDIADELGSNITTVNNRRKRVLSKIRTMLGSRMNIHSCADINLN